MGRFQPENPRKPSVAFFLAAFFLAVSLLALPSAVLAQLGSESPSEIRGNEVGALVDRLRRLERDINLLQKQVYGGREENAVDPAAGSSSRSSRGSAHSVAWIKQNFADLDEQLRQLTNMIEEVGHQTRQTQDRLQVVNDDTAARLDALENQLGTLTGGAVAAQTATAADRPSFEAPSLDAAAQAEAAQGGVLGQLRVPISRNDGDVVSDQGDNTADTADTATADNKGEEVALLPAALPKEQYDFAVALLWGSDYAKAERALREFIKMNPQNALVGNAQYWLGETYYARKNYTQAAVVFAEGYKKYQDGKKGPDFLLKLALSLSQIEESQQACRTLAELESAFPNAPKAIKKRADRERKTLECP